MSYDVDDALKRLERKLKALRAKNYIPDSLLEIVARTAAMQADARARVSVALPEGLATPDAHVQGAPLLARDAFPYDRAVTAQLFGRLLAMLHAAGGSLGMSADAFKARLEAGEVTLEALCDAMLRDDEAFFETWAGKMPEAPSLVRFLALGSLVPSLEAVASLLALNHDPESVWQHGHCPLCGSAPLISRIAGKEGARYSTCSFCRHEYRTARLQCPFCLETAAEKLEYFTADGEPGYQVHVCRSCDSYIKLADFREYDRESTPVLDDLESLALDILARQQGFSRPTASAWGF